MDNFTGTKAAFFKYLLWAGLCKALCLCAHTGAGEGMLRDMWRKINN